MAYLLILSKVGRLLAMPVVPSPAVPQRSILLQNFSFIRILRTNRSVRIRSQGIPILIPTVE